MKAPSFKVLIECQKEGPILRHNTVTLKNVKAQILKVQKRKSRLSKKNNKIHTDIMHFNMNSRLKGQWGKILE